MKSDLLHKIFFASILLASTLLSCSKDDDVKKDENVAPEERWKQMFIEVPPMITPRNGGQPVLLKDGRLLVVGGFTGTPTPDDKGLFCEFYNPETKTWTETNWRFPSRGFSSNYFSGGHYMNGKAAVFTLPNGHVVIGGGWDNDGPINGIYELDPNDPNPANIKFYPFDRVGSSSHLSCTGIIGLDDNSIVAAGASHIVRIKDGVSTDIDTNWPTNVGVLSTTSLFHMGGKKFFTYLEANELRFYDLDKKPKDVYDYMRDFSHGYDYFEVLGTQVSDSVFLMGGGFTNSSNIGRGYAGLEAYTIDLHKNKRTGPNKNEPTVAWMCTGFDKPEMTCRVEVSDIIRLKDGRFHLFTEHESKIFDPVSGSWTPGYTWSEKFSEYLNVPDFQPPWQWYDGTELPSGDLFVAFNSVDYDILQSNGKTTYYIIKKP